MPGNSLLGLTRVDPNEFDKQDAKGNVQAAIFGSPYQRLVDDVNRRIEVYKRTDRYAENQTQAREDIRTLKRDANGKLDALLLDRFRAQKIGYEGATWDDLKNREGKPQKRPLTAQDVQALRPFHWGFEFHKVLQERGGFDAIITNPPWDVFQTDEKEFFQDYVPEIQKKKIRIEDWKKQQLELMKQPELRDAWLEYASSYPHVAKYFKTSPQYPNQISIVNGRNVGSKINLYTYFTEQCFNLLRDGGQCGIVIPSGIYTDLGAKQLREMLFAETQITGLFCFENRKEIFEGVHRSFKFVVLSFTKGGHTDAFPAAFMRLETKDLELFPEQLGLDISVDLIRKLSPQTLAVMEFKEKTDIDIAEKVGVHPALGEITESWNVTLMQEINMTTDSRLLQAQSTLGSVPLMQGGMLHQFDSEFASPKYWLSLQDGRAEIIGRKGDLGQKLSYQDYRFAHRRIARNTDTRTAIACVVPPNRFCADTAQTVRNLLPNNVTVVLVTIFNSFVVDYQTRQRVTAHCDAHFMYSLPIPRITEENVFFSKLLERGARLTCTTLEFDALAKKVGLRGYEDGVTDPEERANLRAELDGLVAHLYGLTETEFAYILTTFPLVGEHTKTAALAAFNRLAPGPEPTGTDAELARLIAAGESAGLEFKATARVNLHTGAPDKRMEDAVLKTVAGFWNAAGGTLLVGVADDGTPLGLDADLGTLGKKRDLDGLELFLTDLLLGGRLHLSGLLAVSFGAPAGKTVCKLEVAAAAGPVWVTVGGLERFYVRTGNSTRELSPSETHEYVRRRWG